MDATIELVPADACYPGSVCFSLDVVVSEEGCLMRVTQPGSACSTLLDMGLDEMPVVPHQGVHAVVTHAAFAGNGGGWWVVQQLPVRRGSAP